MLTRLRGRFRPTFRLVSRRPMMDREQPPRGLLCPGCGSGLEPLGAGAGEEHRLSCPHCGETFRARRRGSNGEFAAVRQAGPPPLGSLSLIWRGAVLRWLEGGYRLGVLAGSLGLLAAGGFVPVIRGWLR